MKMKMIPVLMGAVFTGYTTNSNAQANKQLSNLTSPTAVNQSLLPGTNNSINLGSSTRQWKNIYLHDGLYLNGILTMHATGTENFFNGPGAGTTAVTGGGNTATGINSLHWVTTGSFNTANGSNALYTNTTGYNNTANGYLSLFYNNTGYNNTANGALALSANATGNDNTATGNQALYNNTTGDENTATGSGTLSNNSTGGYNTATGFWALFSNTTGNFNTATGQLALFRNTTGGYNTANGLFTLENNTTGYQNTATGNDALENNTTGSYNTATGNYALSQSTTGVNNTAIGSQALWNNTTGSRNTALGANVGAVVTTGIRNTLIGFRADCGSGTLNNATALGNEATVTASNTVRIGNSGVTSIGGYVNWSNISDGRVKKNIKSNVPGLAFINKLNPITYNLDLDAADKIIQPPVIKTKDGKTVEAESEDVTARKAKERIIYTGFVAQEVEKAAKELNYDFSGVDAAKNGKDLYGLRYADFVVPLVKAVQELSKMNSEKDAKIADLQKQMDELKAMVVNNSTAGNASVQPTTKITFTGAVLEQNIPNPFTNTTRIFYTLPQSLPAGAKAQLMITDKSGKTIKQVALSGAGRGSVDIDAGALTSGAYSYSLYVDGKLIATREMLLAK